MLNVDFWIRLWFLNFSFRFLAGAQVSYIFDKSCFSQLSSHSAPLWPCFLALLYSHCYFHLWPSENILVSQWGDYMTASWETWPLRLERILMQFREAVCHYFLFEMDTLAVRTGVYWPCHVGNMWEKDQSHLKSINGHLAATLQTQQYSGWVHPWEKKLTFKASFRP